MANAQNTALSQAENNALSVSYEVEGQKVVLDMNFVTHYLVRGRADLVTPQEVMFFINLCKAQNLNPLTGGEVYLIKYSEKEPAQTVIGKQAYMKRMFEHPDYICKEDGLVTKRGNEIVHKEGTCLYPGEELIGGWCRVHFVRNGKERTAYKEVALQEYDKGMANWKSKPATMINKVAISQCAREAFPKEYEGMYSEDEMVASGTVPGTYEEVDTQTGEVVETLDYQKITQDQRQEFMDAISKAYECLGGKGKEFLNKKKNGMFKKILAELGLKSTSEMTVGGLNKALELVKQYAAEDEDIQALNEADASAEEPGTDETETVEETSN